MSDEPPKLTVHLIDHDSANLILLFDHLSEAGFRVAASSDALDALEALARIKPEVVVCNAAMPGFSGLEFLDRILAGSPRAQVILLADQGGWQEHEEARRRGAVDLLFKPCRAKTVLRAVERVFGELKR